MQVRNINHTSRTDTNLDYRSYECCTKVAECLDPPSIPTVIRLQYTSLTFPTCTIILLGSYRPMLW